MWNRYALEHCLLFFNNSYALKTFKKCPFSYFLFTSFLKIDALCVDLHDFCQHHTDCQVAGFWTKGSAPLMSTDAPPLVQKKSNIVFTDYKATPGMPQLCYTNHIYWHDIYEQYLELVKEKGGDLETNHRSKVCFVVRISSILKRTGNQWSLKEKCVQFGDILGLPSDATNPQVQCQAMWRFAMEIQDMLLPFDSSLNVQW